jgi:hypothetical protein
VTTEVLVASKGCASNPATGRKPISADGPSYQRTEGGFEEFNVPTKPE